MGGLGRCSRVTAKPRSERGLRRCHVSLVETKRVGPWGGIRHPLLGKRVGDSTLSLEGQKNRDQGIETIGQQSPLPLMRLKFRVWHFGVVSGLGDLKIVAVPLCASVFFFFL